MRRPILLDDRARSRLGLWMGVLGIACILCSVALLGLSFLKQINGG